MWWCGFGPWAVVCPALDYRAKGKVLNHWSWKIVWWPDHVGPEGIVSSWDFILRAMLSHSECPLSKGVIWSNLVFKILFWMLYGEEIIKAVRIVGKWSSLDKRSWRLAYRGQHRDSLNELIHLLKSGHENGLDARVRDMPMQQKMNSRFLTWIRFLGNDSTVIKM